MKPTSRSGIFAFSGMSAVTFGLGVWQIQRYEWKKGLIADNTEKFNQPCVELTSVEPDLTSKHQGRRVKFEGYYDHSREVLWGPRTSSTPEKKMMGMSSGPQGFQVITPMMLKCGNGAVIYVNRGWVKRDVTKSAPHEFERPTWATVTGVVQKPEEKSAFSPINTPASGRLLWLSGKDLVLASNCRAGSNTQFDDGGLKTSESQENAAEEEPVIVEEIKAKEDHKTGTYPIPRNAKYTDTNFVTPETHMAYAVSWFMLSGVAIFIAYMTYKRRKVLLFKQARRQLKL